MLRNVSSIILLLSLAACGAPEICLEEGETGEVIQIGEEVEVIADHYYEPEGSHGPHAGNPRVPATEGGRYKTTEDTFIRFKMKDHVRVCSANGIAKSTLKPGDKIKSHENQWLRRVF